MLSRQAENLFWAGRYTERAEDTARLVDVVYHALLESSPDQVRQAWAQVLEVLDLDQVYAGRHEEVDPDVVVTFLVSDEDNLGSVVASVRQGRENLRSVRELVSTELWEATNRLYLELMSRDLADDLAGEPYDLFAFVKRGCQTITGVATETMPRDDGWRFLTLGRMLERAEMGCRLLDVRFGSLADHQGGARYHDFVAVLKSASAFEAFRKSYRSSLDARDVAEFLLLSPHFPRSVLFSLQAAEQQLERLGPGTDHGRARRALGRVRSAVEYRNVDELLDVGLHDFLADTMSGVAGVADAVAHEYFRANPVGVQHAVLTS